MSIDLSYLEYCKRARPNWIPENGQASSFNEFLIFMNIPLGYVWVVVLLLFLWKRSALFGVLLILNSLALLVLATVNYTIIDELHLGRLGGCVGSLNVTVTILITACLFDAIIAARGLFNRSGKINENTSKS